LNDRDAGFTVCFASALPVKFSVALIILIAINSLAHTNVLILQPYSLVNFAVIFVQNVSCPKNFAQIPP